MKFKIATLVLLMGSLGLFLGCIASPSTGDTDNTKLKITTSFYPLAYFAQQVVGDWGEVTSLTPTGTEPHAFEPSAKAVASVYESDLFLFNCIDFADERSDRRMASLERVPCIDFIIAAGSCTVKTRRFPKSRRRSGPLFTSTASAPSWTIFSS